MVLVLSVCVVVQVLGSPVTIVGGDSTTDVVKAALSEGFTIVSKLHKPVMISFLYCDEIFLSSRHGPILTVSVFHPPDA